MAHVNLHGDELSDGLELEHEFEGGGRIRRFEPADPATSRFLVARVVEELRGPVEPVRQLPQTAPHDPPVDEPVVAPVHQPVRTLRRRVAHDVLCQQKINYELKIRNKLRAIK